MIIFIHDSNYQVVLVRNRMNVTRQKNVAFHESDVVVMSDMSAAINDKLLRINTERSSLHPLNRSLFVCKQRFACDQKLKFIREKKSRFFVFQ